MEGKENNVKPLRLDTCCQRTLTYYPVDRRRRRRKWKDFFDCEWASGFIIHEDEDNCGGGSGGCGQFLMKVPNISIICSASVLPILTVLILLSCIRNE
jgi:hypothetical protein